MSISCATVSDPGAAAPWPTDSGGSSFHQELLFDPARPGDCGAIESGSRKLESLQPNVLPPNVQMTISNWVDRTRETQEHKLRESEERFVKAFRSCPLAMSISTCRDGKFLEVNDAFLRILHYERSEVIGYTAAELDVWVEPGQRDTLVRELASTGSLRTVPMTFKTSRGEIRKGSMSAELIEVHEQQCILAITQDLTEEKLLEEQFRQAQKMEALGRLAGGVAHDFNNMLSIIMGYSDLSLQDPALPPSTSRNIGLIKGAAERAAKGVRQLLAFSRQQVLYPHTLDLNRVISGMVTMIERMIGEDVTLSVRLFPSECLVEADLGQLEQTVMNLAVNARDAMPEGGHLLIETSTLEVDDVPVDTNTALQSGSYASLCITDTGCGMDANTIAHIFEPFFTTKQQGTGTGLGLSTVYGIVKQSNGQIWVHSEIGKGTTFKIYFPLVHAPATKISPKSDPGLLTGTETILVVEDDDALRELICIHLRSAGYAFLQARNAEEALQMFYQAVPRVDVLLTDGIMPGISGIELARCLRSVDPGLRILLMSGYTTETVTRHKALDPDILFIEKPFTRNKLLVSLRSLLHGSSNPSGDVHAIDGRTA